MAIRNAESEVKVLLAYRSKAKGGKSIEGIFQQFLREPRADIQFIPWEYDLTKSLFSNVRSIRRQPVDIWHITGDINFMALALWGKRTVLTIHDIGRYRELISWRKWIFGMVWLKWPLRIADVVTVVSAYTRNEILKLTRNKFASKIRVIHNAINSIYSGVPCTFNSQRPRILLLGTAPHKNLETVFEAVSGMDCVLSIIGKLNDRQVSLLHEAGIVFETYHDLSDDEVREQYSLSDMVLFPSLHEGFGMPIIEAQAIGRPLITSRLTSLPEVAGTGAHYLDNPLDAEELRQAILKIIEHEEYRYILIEEGFKNVQQFAWPNMMNAYIREYKNVMTL